MTAIPTDLAVYYTSPRYDLDTVPQKLLRDHALKSNVYGRIVVVQGEVEYWVDGDPPNMTLLVPEDSKVRVLPEQRHWIKPLAGSLFYLEFLRVET